MRGKATLAQQFAAAQAARDEAQREYERIRGRYFWDRRCRAQAGEELEPLEVTDSNVWSEQLNRERIARENGEQDRRAGLLA